MTESLPGIFAQFEVPGTAARVQPYGSGHIHSTYLIETGEADRFILQKINRRVFPDLGTLQANLLAVTSHLAEKQKRRHPDDWERRVLRPVPTRAGDWTLRTPDGAAWRAFHFIPGAQTFAGVQTSDQAFALGKAAGEFQAALSDLAVDLGETIPGFHDTRGRFETFRLAVGQAEPERLARAGAEIEFASAREEMVDHLAGLQAGSRLPVRITHNDAKISNVLFDAITGEALCLVDLDTVMPGLSLYDFGDMVRSGTATLPEDAGSLDALRVDPARFGALAQGYFAAAGPFLTDLERGLLVFSGRLLTYETGLRFLTDYLQGDVYFRTAYERQNLDRCRNQFHLVAQIERQAPHLEALVVSAWDRIIS